MSLRLAIAEKHEQAENHPFTKLLLSGQMPVPVYADFVRNQHHAYAALESLADRAGLFHDLPGIARTPHLAHDLTILGDAKPTIFPSSRDFAAHIAGLPTDRLWAHIYVRHMADMYGGQVIKRHAPVPTTAYEFPDRVELIAKLRTKLSDDLADEANVGFDFMLRLFDELAEAHGIHAT